MSATAHPAGRRSKAVSPAATRRALTARDVAAARALLTALAERGSPALRADLEPVLAQLDGFVGHTPLEIWAELGQVEQRPFPTPPPSPAPPAAAPASRPPAPS